MTKLSQWIATIAAAVLLLILVILEVSDGSSKVKAWLWILGVVLLVAGIGFDLYRQRKLKLPDLNA